MLHQLRWKAICIALLASFIASVIWGIFSATLILPHFAEPISANHPIEPSSAFILTSLAGCFVSSLVAGWVSARLASGAEFENSFAVGVIIILISAALFFPTGMNKLPLYYNLPAFALTLPFSILGGLIRRKGRVGNAS